MALSPGSRLGPYDILSLLGTGGMGVVYRARDTRLNRTVAIKILPFADPESKMRFEREAKAIAALTHPHICTLYDVGQQDETDYFVMEYLEGETLQRRLRRDRIAIDTVIEWATQAADALDAAHGVGIIHRDVKPANLFVTTRALIKMLDFGLAKISAVDARGASAPTVAGPVTVAGSAVGTVAYMSPEQARGDDVDARSDLFSLGVVVYEMATGQRPFDGPTSAVIFDGILNRRPVATSHLNLTMPVELDRIIARCLEKHPSARYQTAGALLDDLRAMKRSREAATTRNTAEAVRLPSIAVLPFSDTSPQKDQDYFCEGIAEELINALAKLDGLHVASRTSAFQFKGQARDIGEIGQRLKVGTILEGSVRRAGNRLRITAQLIDVEDGYHLWSERYDRDLDDVFAVQDEIACAIVETLKVKLSGAPDGALVKRPTDDLESYNLYLQGRYFWSRREPGQLQRAIECFEQAIARDGSYAQAYAGLADGYSTLGYSMVLPPRVAFATAKTAAERAVALDDRLAEAHHARARIQWMFDWEFAGAEREYRRALALNPISGLTHATLGILLASIGRFDDAIGETRRSLALEPVSVLVGQLAANTLRLARRFEEALAESRRVLELDSSSTLSQWQKASTLSTLARHTEAVDAAERAIALSHRQILILALSAPIFSRAGRRTEAEAIQEELRTRSQKEYISPYALAVVSIALEEFDHAWTYLEQACEERTPLLVHAAVTSVFDPLRADPRFGVLLKNLGLAGVSPAGDAAR